MGMCALFLRLRACTCIASQVPILKDSRKRRLAHASSWRQVEEALPRNAKAFPAQAFVRMVLETSKAEVHRQHTAQEPLPAPCLASSFNYSQFMLGMLGQGMYRRGGQRFASASPEAHHRLIWICADRSKSQISMMFS